MMFILINSWTSIYLKPFNILHTILKSIQIHLHKKVFTPLVLAASKNSFQSIILCQLELAFYQQSNPINTKEYLLFKIQIDPNIIGLQTCCLFVMPISYFNCVKQWNIKHTVFRRN